MISFKKSMHDLQRMDTMFQVSLDCYLSAIDSVQRHLPDLRSSFVDEHRENLKALHVALSASPGAEELVKGKRKLDAEMKDFREKSAIYQSRHEQSLRDVMVALAEAAATVSAEDAKNGEMFGGFAKQLESVARIDDLNEVRSHLHEHVKALRTFASGMSQKARTSVAHMRGELAAVEKRLKEAERMAATDPLTGMLNRREGERALEERINAGRPFCLVIADLNRFKAINDRYGHVGGDEVLKEFARRLSAHVRPGDLSCRWGGDEFVVILDCNLRDALFRARQLAERAVGRYLIRIKGENQSLEVGACFGVAEHLRGETSQQLFTRADDIMYKQKAAAHVS